MSDDDEALKVVINKLAERFGRLPTEDEVMDFIYGTPVEREAIYNKEVER